jgi:lipopolysaccharide/colanic/teichoic acid biosynthesis glycosyltransferase
LDLSGDKSVVLSASHGEVERVAATPWPHRCFDLVLTVLALPVVALAGAAIALAIYIDSPGPVIYRSRRVGRGGKRFEMLKFRKMRRESPSHPVTLHDDDRFTPIGRFLAATRLDELPQFVNVLRGEMRLVGPRPELEYFTAQYADEYAEILTVTPGITGNAQLQFVDEKSLLKGPSPATTYADQVLPAKIAIDLDYVRHRSLIRDLVILAHTLALPFALLSARVRASSASMRIWIPSVAAAMVLALAFILVSSHLP